MTDFLPAWSEPFHGDELGSVPALEMRGRITRRWAYGDGSGAGVRVAIVDSGVEDGHPLVGRVDRAIAVERDDSNDDGVRFVDAPHDDLYGHGTACAGIIRALAPAVEIVSVRVLSSNLKGSAFAFAHGLDWCIDNGVHVANLSLSTVERGLCRDVLRARRPSRLPTRVAGVGTQQRAQTQHPQRVRGRVLRRVHPRHEP